MYVPCSPVPLMLLKCGTHLNPGWLLQLTEENQRLELQHEALDAKVAHFHKIVEQVEFIERAPTTTLSPLQHTVENLPALQESLQRMSSITAQLEHDSAQFKRQRLDTRASYRTSSLSLRFRLVVITPLDSTCLICMIRQETCGIGF